MTSGSVRPLAAAASLGREIPKSRTTGSTTNGPRRASMMLLGLRSRWTRPLSWMAAAAEMTGSNIEMARETASRSSRNSSASSVSPSRSSITR